MQALIWHPLCLSSVQSEWETFLKTVSDVRRFPMKSSNTLSRVPEGIPTRPSNYRQSAATVWITFFYQARKSSAKQIFTLCLIITALWSQHSWRTSHSSIPGGWRKRKDGLQMTYTEGTAHTHTIQMQTPTHRDTNTINLSTTGFDGD